MKDRAAALRYARALEASLDGDAEVARAADELAAAARVLSDDPLIGEALAAPGVDAARRGALIDTLSRLAGFSIQTKGFLRLLAEQGRLGLLPLSAEMIGKIRDRRLGIVEAEVTTAAPLGPEMEERTRRTLEKTLGKTVRVALKTDPALIGGMVAKVGSTVYDGSVRTRLAALRGHLVRN